MADVAEVGLRVAVVLLGDGPGPVGIRAANRLDGWARAEGDVVAFFDTRYEAGPLWSLAAESAASVVGGYVLPADSYAWAGWVYYVVEYGWRPRLAAGNVAYRRASVSQIEEMVVGEGAHDARMDVRLARPPSFTSYWRERYRFSFDWGSAYVRPSVALLRVGLPLVVLARTTWWRKPLTLPGVILIGCVMAVGEMAGSLLGGSGKVSSE
jgi:hypothetical protein